TLWEFEGIPGNQLESNGAYWNPLEPIRIHWSPLESIGIYWNLLKSTGAHWNPLELTGILKNHQNPKRPDSALSPLNFLLGGTYMSHRDSKGYVPHGELRRTILRIYHDTAANGAHFGRDKTLYKIKQRYF
ncbi:unnamed protein product, partial [Adineta steineri]